jgi:2-methylisocitrate lyase-like PEP mutase family enzyme
VTKQPGPACPGSSPLRAQRAQHADFDLVYASGGSIVRGFGLPDLGLADPGKLAERYCQIADAVEVPVFADAGNRFGYALGPYVMYRASAPHRGVIIYGGPS